MIPTTPPSSKAHSRLSGWLAAAGLAATLALGVPGTAQAQDSSSTRQQDTAQSSARAESTSSDTSKWGYHVERNPSEQNPPGYRGMERPAGLGDSTAAPDSSAPTSATSRINQIERQNDSGKAPPKQPALGDSAGQDSTKWGYKVNRNPDVQNPPGYRGMERPAGLDSTKGASALSDSVAAQSGKDSASDTTRNNR